MSGDSGVQYNIYIYCSYEDTYFFNVFYKVNGRIVHKHQLNEAQPGGNYDVSRERQRSMLRIGIDDLEKIHKKCKEFNRDMPTEIKMHYNVKENKLQAKYKYDLVWSNTELLTLHDVFDSWFEEVKQENKNRND